MAEQHIRVLLVEGNSDASGAMREMLSAPAAWSGDASETEVPARPGFEIELAESAAAATERLTEPRSDGPIDVVLLDLSLPDSEGLPTFEVVHSAAPHIPKIVLTTTADDRLAVQAVRAGAQDYLIKGQLDAALLTRSIRYAIERQRARDTLQRHARNLVLLHRASHALTASLDLDQVLATFLEETRRLLDVTTTSVWLVDPRSGDLVCRHCSGPRSDMVRGYRLTRGQGIAGWVADTGQSLVVADALMDHRHHADLDHLLDPPPRAVLSVPLRSTTRLVGVLQAMDSRVNRFNRIHLALLQFLAPTAATAITNAQLYEQARRDAADSKARNNELDAFAHTVAHDLKNPLTTVISFANLLEEDLAALQGREEMQRCAQYITQSARKMLSIVEELLLLAGVRQKDDAVMVPLDMGSIVAEALQRLIPLIQERGAKIRVPAAWPAVIGHAPWVEEVWVNYISNAINYGGVPPVVEIDARSTSQGMTVFHVQDNGSGLVPEDQARLFTPFTRLDQVNTKGYGLGLSIVRRIVERMGGRVGVVSKPGQGSIFYFTLPTQPNTSN
jgi:signal transduction histidine kinase/CheY-like chemotaxis protein